MKYAFVVSACKKYVPELTGLLNSLEAIGNNHDVFLIGYELPKDFTDQFSKLSFRVEHYDIPEAEAREYGGESEILCRKRYWYAGEWGAHWDPDDGFDEVGYDAICLLDADMLLVRPVDQFFEIAAKCGLILGVTLEQKTVYGTDEDGHDHQRVMGEHIVKEKTWNDKDMCCTPMFINPKRFEDQLKLSWEIFTHGYPNTNFKAPDQQALNMILVAEKLTDRVVLLPNVQWVSSNEKLLKPYTRMSIQRDGKIWTESGEPVFIVHGQYWKLRWRRGQVMARHGCAEGYLGYSFNSDNMARGAMQGLYEFFMKIVTGGPIQIEKKAYCNGGDPGDSCLEGNIILEDGSDQANKDWNEFKSLLEE